MTHAPIAWEQSLPTALARAAAERRFLLVDFSKEH